MRAPPLRPQRGASPVCPAYRFFPLIWAVEGVRRSLTLNFLCLPLSLGPPVRNGVRVTSKAECQIYAISSP